MKLLFTGASGFLGNNIRPLLEEIYSVITVGLTLQDNYTADIAREVPELQEEYDVVLHAAYFGDTHPVISVISTQSF